MRLDRLLGGVDVVETRGDPSTVDVRAVTHDSRRVVPGTLFCCLPGRTADGHDYAPLAVESGATALLCERLVGVDVVQARVGPGRARPAMAQVAAELFGHPSRRLVVAGVTGTNGKTTVTYMLRSIFDAHGWPATVIGTLSGTRTTPEAPELQEILARHLADGGRAAAIEVSSHALVQHRVDAVWFAAAVFTNLSHDHLDFHGSMDAYFDAKAALFRAERAAVGVVNVDDPWGRRLLERTDVEVVPYALADAADAEVGITASRFTWRGQRVRVHLGGELNVSNALAAATTAAALGVPGGAIAEGLDRLRSVPGRLEVVDAGQPFTVVVDYAHTPDGLAEVLGVARSAAPAGRVAVVFGCGGERDREKRPRMGDVATTLADLAVLTSDNPRGEDPDAIIAEVRAGISRTEALVVEPDRRAAIALALRWAQPGDVVVVAGKGHETGQIVGKRVLPFDDREVARSALAALGSAR